MHTQRYSLGMLAFTIGLSMLPAPASTQTARKTAANITITGRADKLEAQAAKLHDQIARYPEAARLYKEAASLRSPTDPRAVESLTLAAHLYHYANRLIDARRTMEQAAQAALARGDVWRASIANLEAALFAYKQGNLSQTERLGRKALKLAESPLLSEEQRASIVGRLRANSSVAALAN